MDFKISPDTLAQLPSGFYAIVGFLIVSNIALFSSALTAFVRHLIDYSHLKRSVAEADLKIENLKKSIDALWDKFRKLE